MLLSLYYYEDLTMREVASVMDISQTRVCQLHARAILTLKALIAPVPEKATKVKDDPPPPDKADPSPLGRDLSAAVVDKRRTSYRARKYWSQMFGEA